ncbi:MAG: hypothetical protein PHW62_05410, partial [Candidatus Ratteibacteria bacterium]|nr:hypothetical protein [Candidatus Ratteibacteria bacterium]
CPLSATHLGKDGLAVRGHVDDYWVAVESEADDPWIGPPGWPEHTKGDCTGDYMGTNQSSLGNIDGSTIFYFDGTGSPLYDYTGGEPAVMDGCHGLRLFVESRGYSVETNGNFSQLIYPNPIYGNTTGFTFADFKSEIDAGRPVLIQIEWHTMLGYGYSETGEKIYIHNTWDYSDHEMTWGGSYSGMRHYGVTVIELAASSKGTVVLDADSYAAPDTVNVTVRDVDLDVTGGPDNTTVDFESDLTGDIETVTLTETGDSTGIFAGSIDTEIGGAAADGTLQVADTDTITVTYTDADDGEGGIDVEVTDTARISLISEPEALTATAGRTYVFLVWNAVDSPILDGYNVYRSSSLTGTKTKVNGALVTNNFYQNMGLTSGDTYYYWVVAVDTYGVETDYSNSVRVTTLTDEGDDEDDNEDDEDGEDGGGGGSGDSAGTIPSGCFIATACYGTPMAKEVKVLSQFRDEYLLDNSLGKIFVAAYYKVSPRIASYISENPCLKNLVRWSLKPLVGLSNILVEEKDK